MRINWTSTSTPKQGQQQDQGNSNRPVRLPVQTESAKDCPESLVSWQVLTCVSRTLGSLFSFVLEQGSVRLSSMEKVALAHPATSSGMQSVEDKWAGRREMAVSLRCSSYLEWSSRRRLDGYDLWRTSCKFDLTELMRSILSSYRSP